MAIVFDLELASSICTCSIDWLHCPTPFYTSTRALKYCQLTSELAYARSHEGREMGAVLWSILALIFVLLSLPNASREDHARGYYSELLLAARGHGRRIRSSEDGDIASGTINPIAQGWSCEECEQNGSRYYDTLEEGFLAGINESIQSLFQQYTGPLLVHAVRF